jgi:hypothetical protein
MKQQHKMISLRNSTISLSDLETKNCNLAVSYFIHSLYFTYEIKEEY